MNLISAVPWSDPKYSQHESSTTKCDLTGKRDFKGSTNLIIMIVDIVRF